MARLRDTSQEVRHASVYTNMSTTSDAANEFNHGATMSRSDSSASRVSSVGRMKRDAIDDFIGNDDKVSDHIASLNCEDEKCGKLTDEDVFRHKVKRSLVQERMADVITGCNYGIKGGIVGYMLKMFLSLRCDGEEGPIQGRKFASSVNMSIHGTKLCQYCFAASYHMLKPDGQYKSSWVEARQLFCKGFTEPEKIVRITKRGATQDLAIPVITTCEKFTQSQERMLAWLYNHCMLGYGERSPLDGAFHMQYCTKVEIHGMYNDRNLEGGEAMISLRVFTEALKKLYKTNWCPHGEDFPFMCRFSKYSAFGKCTLCICIVLEIKATLNKGRRAYLLSLLQCHREIAYREKKAWYVIREQALSSSYLWSLGADNLDKRKTRFINLGRELKGHGCDDLHTISATLGVVPVAGVGNFVFIASPLLADNCNLILETLHLTLMLVTKDRQQKGKILAPELDVQVDGCSVNKNRTKWAWMAWLCVTGQMKKCSDNYMLVGHTHDLMDAILGVIARWIKSGLVITTMQDLKNAVENSFRSLYTKPVAVIFIHSVHDWTKFFHDYVAPVSKFNANVPDHERPHRFEVWLDEVTKQPVMHYKNLRQQDFYWNKDPVRLLPKGVQDLSQLQVAMPSNNPAFVCHLRGLAGSRGQFLKNFDVDIESLQAQVGHSKQQWTDFWDMFSESVIIETYNAVTKKTSKKTVHRLKADLSAVDNWCVSKVHRIDMLPQVSNIPIAPERVKVVHVVPPVAPIFIPRNVKQKFTEELNTDVERKHLTAFVEGATDTDCVRAARKMIKSLTEADNPKPKAKPKAKPKPKPKPMPNAEPNAKKAARGKKKTTKQKDDEAKAGLSKEHTAVINQMKKDEPGLLSQDELKTSASPRIEFKVKEACIGVKLHVHLAETDLICGLEWDPAVLTKNENKIVWQPTSRAFECDDDFIEALNETWTINRLHASDVER